MDCIEIATIAKEKAADPALSKIVSYVKKGQAWIPKLDAKAVQRFKTIMPELTVTGNGILLKDDRMFYPLHCSPWLLHGVGLGCFDIRSCMVSSFSERIPPSMLLVNNVSVMQGYF